MYPFNDQDDSDLKTPGHDQIVLGMTQEKIEHMIQKTIPKPTTDIWGSGKNFGNWLMSRDNNPNLWWTGKYDYWKNSSDGRSGYQRAVMTLLKSKDVIATPQVFTCLDRFEYQFWENIIEKSLQTFSGFVLTEETVWNAVRELNIPMIKNVDEEKSNHKANIAEDLDEEIEYSAKIQHEVPAGGNKAIDVVATFTIDGLYSHDTEKERFENITHLVETTQYPKHDKIFRIESDRFQQGMRKTVFTKDLKVYIEVKTVIPSYGELMRQINRYRQKYPGLWFVVSPDDRFKTAIESQGVHFWKWSL